MLFDLPLTELQRYYPERREPEDFDAFWQDTLTAARAFDLAPRFEATPTPLRTVSSYDVTFAGYGGAPVRGWLTLPAGTTQPLPCVVEFIGYGGGRGYPTDHLLYASAGYAHLVMDTRGQGTAWRVGDTSDPQADGAPHLPGFMTQGVRDPRAYYYRRVFTDAVRAVEAARAHPLIDPTRVAVAGGSQGGGITLAVAGLQPDVTLALPDVPFLCHFDRAVTLTDSAPYSEIAAYCRIHRDEVPRVFETLNYFDGLHFAARARATALFSVGLMDLVCPPSTVYAAFNHYAGQKDIRVYPFNGHEGGDARHSLEKLAFLNAHLPLE